MSDVVNAWYPIFYKIALLVYMAVLVVVGILVMLNSTAEKKAKYKSFMLSWCVGICMLIFFPYVMKYEVMLNEAFVEIISTYTKGRGNQVPLTSDDEIIAARKQVFNEYGLRTTAYVLSNEQPRVLLPSGSEEECIEAVSEIIDSGHSNPNDTFGHDSFMILMGEPGVFRKDGNQIVAVPGNVRDVMLLVRIYAHKHDRLILMLAYGIMVGQTLVLLILYYKRAFMIAFLITIFPLVAMTYVLDKVGDKRAQSFGIWFKEYTVNVIVQIFHATVYALLVGTSVEMYIDSGGQEVIFLILCILFLFQGEKILRNIFNVKSSANTIGDLAKTGVALYGAAKMFGKGGGGDNSGSKRDNKDVSSASERQAKRETRRANATSESSGATGGSSSGGTGGSGGSGTSEAQEEPVTQEEARDKVVMSAMARRVKKGIASRGVSFAGKTTGAMLGATFGMAKGDTDSGELGNAMQGAMAGKAIGEGVVSPISGMVNKAEQMRHGSKNAKKISEGQMDAEYGIDEAALRAQGIDPNEVVGKHGETIQQIYREAIARMYKATARRGASKGELEYWNYIDENTKT